MPLDSITVSLAVLAAVLFVKEVLVPELANSSVCKSTAGSGHAHKQIDSKNSRTNLKTKAVGPAPTTNVNSNSRGGRQLPPSPPSDPLIGNARVMPLEYAWKTFASWSKSYGSYLLSRLYLCGSDINEFVVLIS